jgi:hypothetical protein
MTPSLVNTTKQINTLNDHGANNTSSETQNQKQLNIYNSQNVLTKIVKSKLMKTKIITQKQNRN